MENEKSITSINIKALRRESGLTQKQFGQEIGVSGEAVSQWEGDSREPSPMNLKSIAIYFDIMVIEITEGLIDANKMREIFSGKINGELKTRLRKTASSLGRGRINPVAGSR